MRERLFAVERYNVAPEWKCYFTRISIICADQDINVYDNWDDTISSHRETISQLLRVLELVKRMKLMERRWNNVFPPNTIVETKRKLSMENQPLLPAEESDNELKGERKIFRRRQARYRAKKRENIISQ